MTLIRKVPFLGGGQKPISEIILLTSGYNLIFIFCRDNQISRFLFFVYYQYQNSQKQSEASQ